MGCVDNKRLVWFPVDNNSCTSIISHEITPMWYIIKLLYCITYIDDVESHTTYFDMLVWRSCSIPEEVRNITMQYIISSAGEPYGILIGKTQSSFLVTWVQYKRSRDIINCLIWTFTLPLREDSYPPVFWTMMFMLWHVFINSEDIDSAPSSLTMMNANLLSWFLNVVTINFRISRGESLLMDVNKKA